VHYQAALFEVFETRSRAAAGRAGERVKGIFILDELPYRDIYGPQERQAIASALEIVAPQQTAASIAAHPELLADVDVIFSGWGAPTMDAGFLAAAPQLQAVFYGAGYVRYFVTEAFWARGIRLTSAAAANAVPVAEFTLAAILFSLKHVWSVARRMKETREAPAHREVIGAYGSTVGLISLGLVGRQVR